MTVVKSARSTPAGLQATSAAAGRVRTLGLILAGLLPVVGLVAFFFYPVGALIGRGFAGPDGMAAFGQVLARSRFQRIIGFTVAQAAASAALCVLLGVPAPTCCTGAGSAAECWSGPR